MTSPSSTPAVPGISQERIAEIARLINALVQATIVDAHATPPRTVMVLPSDEARTRFLAARDALTAEFTALARGATEDGARLDWLEQRVDGTGETLSFGGVCYWGINVQKSPHGKHQRIGEGEDLRAAIDDAIDAARSTQEGTST